MRARLAIVASLACVVTSACGNSTVPATCPNGGCDIVSSAPEDTDFAVQGRTIYLSMAPRAQSTAARPAPQAVAAGAKVPFFIKGLDYSPAPIGGTTIDSPLKDNNSAIWSRDLPLIRAMGANAIHVYNVTPPPYDQQVGSIYKFLNAAWNNGKSPVYVLMSVHFQGDALLNSGAVQSLAAQYHDLDKKYASYPAVIGVSISNEIGDDKYIANPTWWANFNIIAKAAKQGFIDGGDPDKIVTTSEADGNLGRVRAGEANGAAVDVWGVNVYRGRTFTTLFTEIQQLTKKPVILTEYGASAAYHPSTGALRSVVGGLGVCSYPKGADNTTINDVASLPPSTTMPSSTPALPNMGGLIDYATNTASTLYSGFQSGAVVSGGFYFEWTDEWWKAGAGNNSAHLGNVAPNGSFPGCYNDEGWYGVNAVAPGTPNVLTARPTLSALKNTWAKEK